MLRKVKYSDRGAGRTARDTPNLLNVKPEEKEAKQQKKNHRLWGFGRQQGFKKRTQVSSTPGHCLGIHKKLFNGRCSGHYTGMRLLQLGQQDVSTQSFLHNNRIASLNILLLSGSGAYITDGPRFIR